jgi:glycosyltransferase 2 family protein
VRKSVLIIIMYTQYDSDDTGITAENGMQSIQRLIKNPWVKRFAQVALAGAILYFMIGYLQDQWSQIENEPLTIDPIVLIVAQLGFIVGMGIQPFGTFLAQRGLGGELSKAAVWQAFFAGQVAKYLPGSLWSLPSRGFLYNQRGLPAKKSIEVVLWETGLAVVAATLLFFSVSAVLLWEYRYLPLIVLEIGGFSAAFLGAGIGLRHPTLRRFFSRIGIVRKLLDIFPHLPLRYVAAITAFFVVQWLIIGAAFMGVVYALDSSITAAEFARGVGVFPGVWAVGLLIVITPGGIGIREALLTVALSSITPDPTPLYAAIIARICWTMAEVVGVVGSSFYYTNERRQNTAVLAPEQVTTSSE